MGTKICSKCKEEKSVAEFNSNGSGGYQTYCRDCKKSQWKNWYSKEENRNSFLKRTLEHNKKHKHSVRQKLFSYLKEHPCIDCGEADPIVLTFDHVRGIKEFQISTKRVTSSWKKISKEIEKCEVRCFNCHIRRHAIENNWYRDLY
jgi:hypothetical protein